jgi:hypothetical protein
MWLGSACTSLRQASLAWFPEVTVEVQPGETDLVSLAAWLERHQGEKLAAGCLVWLSVKLGSAAHL